MVGTHVIVWLILQVPRDVIFWGGVLGAISLKLVGGK